MKKTTVLLMAILTGVTLLLREASASRDAATSTMPPRFHLGERKTSPKVQAIIEKATADFDLVINGKKPRFSFQGADTGDLADGGSSEFKGRGYVLWVRKAIARLGDVDGYFYGPEITFDSSTGISSSWQISHVEFYTTAEMKKLLKE